MENLFELLLAVCGALLAVAAFAFTSERGTQILKTILRWIAAKLNIDALAPSGVSSWLLALVVAGLITYGFDIDVLSEFEMFQGLDPELVRVMNMVFVWVMSQFEHDKIPKISSSK